MVHASTLAASVNRSCTSCVRRRSSSRLLKRGPRSRSRDLRMRVFVCVVRCVWCDDAARQQSAGVRGRGKWAQSDSMHGLVLQHSRADVAG